MADNYNRSVDRGGGGAGRTILIILVVVVLLAIAAVATGFVNLKGDSGALPKIAVQGGRAPSVDADVGKVVVGTKSTSVDVPKVTTTKESVDVPVIGVQKPMASSDGARAGVVAIVAAILLPPLGVFLREGLSTAFWVDVLLTILAWVPGVLFALVVVLKPDLLPVGWPGRAIGR